jgi:hypothetical protein
VYTKKPEAPIFSWIRTLSAKVVLVCDDETKNAAHKQGGHEKKD